MLRLINNIAVSLLFWRLMFFMMVGVAGGFYANPQVVIQYRYIHRAIDRNPVPSVIIEPETEVI